MATMTSSIEPRTYRREDILESRRRWADGDFGAEWRTYRELAASKGFVFPPTGSRHDSADDPDPSQRSVIYQAIEDTPRLLRSAIARSRSWHDVVRILLAERASMRQTPEPASTPLAPSRTEAIAVLRDILEAVRR